MQTVVRVELGTELITGPVNLAQLLINAVIGDVGLGTYPCLENRLCAQTKPAMKASMPGNHKYGE